MARESGRKAGRGSDLGQWETLDGLERSGAGSDIVDPADLLVLTVRSLDGVLLSKKNLKKKKLKLLDGS